MYLEFYNLKEKPFSLTPDPAYLYHSQSHKRAIAFLRYGLQESKGFLQLTGPVGSGKTTLLRAILSTLDEKTRTAYIINPSAPFPDLLRSIMKDLEIPNMPQTRVKTELLDFFHEYLLAQARRSNRVVVIFDEAQNLSLKNLEEIRMLSNFETTKEKLVQIVLVGQPELIAVLERQDLRQLKQRIQVRYNLAPLEPPEVKEYINHRLRIAGSRGEIEFTDETCEGVYRFSKGIPRLINSLCDVILLIGYVSEKKRFNAAIVEEAIREINGSFSDEPAQQNEGDEKAPLHGSPARVLSVQEAPPASGGSVSPVLEIEEGASSAWVDSRRAPVAADQVALCSGEQARPHVQQKLEEAPADEPLEAPIAKEREGAEEANHENIASASPPGPLDRGKEWKKSASITNILFLLRRIASQGKGLLKKRSSEPGGFVNPKVMILLKQNEYIKGVATNLNPKDDGFYFLNIDGRNGRVAEFMAFEKIIALRLIENFEEEWETKAGGKSSQPRGRQIVVALINGQVVEGITLDTFDSCCERFFVISPNDAGNPSWTLIEKTSAAGILTENFKDGIYAEKFENPGAGMMESSNETVSGPEAKGDFFFGMNAFEAALNEYHKGVTGLDTPERLQTKISLSHLNIAIKCLQENKYRECRLHLGKIAAPELSEEAAGRAAKIKAFLNGVNGEAHQ